MSFSFSFNNADELLQVHVLEWIAGGMAPHVTASACRRTAVRSGPLFVRSGVALCPPQCVFHS